MPEWLNDSFLKDEGVHPRDVFVRLAIAFALGCVVAAIYRLTHRRVKGRSSGLVPTLVLLTILIAMMTLVIGNSIARAFSLVGALAIVRFRTVVEDTRDTAFVIFAVAVGMAVGAGYRDLPLIGILFAGLAAFVFRPKARLPIVRPDAFTLSVRIGLDQDPEALLREILDKHLDHFSFLASETARQGSALEVSYRIRMRRQSSPMALFKELIACAGVQKVDIREA